MINQTVAQVLGIKGGNFAKVKRMNCPQQPNTFDCGVYVCLNMKILREGSRVDFKSYPTKDSNALRRHIAEDLRQPITEAEFNSRNKMMRSATLNGEAP